MSHAEYNSSSLPVFSKLATMLRNIPAVQFVWTKVAALLRGDKSDESLINSFLDASPPTVTQTTFDHVALLKSSSDLEIAPKSQDDQSDRERLIRRRWTETGSRIWNPNVHGTGLAALNIQGSVELLPPGPGEMLPRYDKLEFKLIAGRIVCEGIVVDPPKSRRKPGAPDGIGNVRSAPTRSRA
jgi:hypothetical protein